MNVAILFKICIPKIILDMVFLLYILPMYIYVGFKYTGKEDVKGYTLN